MFPRKETINQSTVTEFLLRGFSDQRDLQNLHIVMFLSVYFMALVGNLLIITAVALNQQIHTPMYFFLVNLALTDVCFISTTVPKSIATSLTNCKLISFHGCVAQVFLVVTFATLELALLTVMAYDRYVAICHPLQYTLIMNWDACTQMAAAAWISSIIHGVVETSATFRLNFCRSNIIRQFFCDMPQLQKIACTATQTNQLLVFIFGLSIHGFCFSLIVASYGYIFSTVLRIPSDQGRRKAFSTCTPHLTVYCLFVITLLFSYMRPKQLSFPNLDLLSAVLYTVLPPVLNPIIYSLRNKDIQEAVWKVPKQLMNLLA